MKEAAAGDKNIVLFQASDLPKQEKKLVISTAGIVWLGEQLAEKFLKDQ